MKIIWTDAAKDDLAEIRQYLKVHQTPAYAQKITRAIRDEVDSLKAWPAKGVYVKELEELNLTQYRELLAEQNRIIFECVAVDTFYIHLVCHTSRDLDALLHRRLLAI